MKLSNNNSGFVLLLSLVLLIFLGLLLEASSLRSNIELQESISRLDSQRAFNAAESGLAAAIDQLRINSKWDPGTAASPGTPPLMNGVALVDDTNPSDNTNPTLNKKVGYYSVLVKTAPDFEHFQSVWIKSIGYSQDPGVQPQIMRSILAQVVVESPTNFFLSTAGNLNILSGADINSSIIGNNINFVVNPALPSPQNNITIGGTVFYLQSVNGNANPAVIIDPPDGGKTDPSPTETFSGVDTDSYTSLAQNGGTYVDGDLTVNGDININNAQFQSANGTPNENGVVFATGDIHISGTVESSMLFVAGGDVYLDGDVVVPDSDGLDPQDNPNAPQIGILAKGNMIIPQASPVGTIDAFLMADGGINGLEGGVLQALGNKLSKGDLTIMGAIAVRGNGVTTAVDLDAYTTRTYTYNTQFLNNVKIPFLPAITQVETWQEINPQCDFTQTIPAQPNLATEPNGPC